MSTLCLQARRAASATAVAVTATLVLAACGGNSNNGGSAGTSTSATPSGSASAPAGLHNQADVTFAQGMIPHHRQAIVMSDMVQAHSSSGEVKALTERIKKAQAPEIETMTAWLRAWGEPVPRG
ncbi:hypothetical protein SMD11_1055 [Streptomyces albireticuli]|uniref:DUF305 domain-containing protein n=1 Tax=Streptomyces albireticuli TaxID=1940 RepID=A0A1Z2KXF6_9ACTN|nr:DUF305 domain-containing protein [Streptomyces albireticuli]ARZ66719.1 hypothetical protein SMD11_1055 [Streptomyces albireticuli]